MTMAPGTLAVETARPPVRAFQIALRVAAIAAGLIAVACTRAAADDPILAIEVAVVVLSLVAALLPDSHIGLLVFLLIGVNWLVAVDDTTSPWAIGAALAVALLHAALAASSVAPVAARWTPAMRRRWSHRVVVATASAVPAWICVAAVDRADIGTSAVLMAAALLTLAIAGLWARSGSLR